MERIGGSETSSKGFGLIENRILVWTLKFDFAVSISLDKGGGLVCTKMGLTAEENANGCAQRESNELVFRVCIRVEAIRPVHRIFRGRCF